MQKERGSEQPHSFAAEMDDAQLTSGTEVSICSHCGHRQNDVPGSALGQERSTESMLQKLQEITTEQSKTIETLRQELHDRDQRNDAIMSHYEQLVRMEKGLARDAEEAERKVETEVGVLIEECERLQSLLTAHGLEF